MFDLQFFAYLRALKVKNDPRNESTYRFQGFGKVNYLSSKVRFKFLPNK